MPGLYLVKPRGKLLGAPSAVLSGLWLFAYSLPPAFWCTCKHIIFEISRGRCARDISERYPEILVPVQVAQRFHPAGV